MFRCLIGIILKKKKLKQCMRNLQILAWYVKQNRPHHRLVLIHTLGVEFSISTLLEDDTILNLCSQIIPINKNDNIYSEMLQTFQKTNYTHMTLFDSDDIMFSASAFDVLAEYAKEYPKHDIFFIWKIQKLICANYYGQTHETIYPILHNFKLVQPKLSCLFTENDELFRHTENFFRTRQIKPILFTRNALKYIPSQTEYVPLPLYQSFQYFNFCTQQKSLDIAFCDVNQILTEVHLLELPKADRAQITKCIQLRPSFDACLRKCKDSVYPLIVQNKLQESPALKKQILLLLQEFVVKFPLQETITTLKTNLNKYQKCAKKDIESKSIIALRNQTFAHVQKIWSFGLRDEATLRFATQVCASINRLPDSLNICHKLCSYYPYSKNFQLMRTLATELNVSHVSPYKIEKSQLHVEKEAQIVKHILELENNVTDKKRVVIYISTNDVTGKNYTTDVSLVTSQVIALAEKFAQEYCVYVANTQTTECRKCNDIMYTNAHDITLLQKYKQFDYAILVKFIGFVLDLPLGNYKKTFLYCLDCVPNFRYKFNVELPNFGYPLLLNSYKLFDKIICCNDWQLNNIIKFIEKEGDPPNDTMAKCITMFKDRLKVIPFPSEVDVEFDTKTKQPWVFAFFEIDSVKLSTAQFNLFMAIMIELKNTCADLKVKYLGHKIPTEYKLFKWIQLIPPTLQNVQKVLASSVFYINYNDAGEGLMESSFIINQAIANNNIVLNCGNVCASDFHKHCVLERSKRPTEIVDIIQNIYFDRDQREKYIKRCKKSKLYLDWDTTLKTKWKKILD